MQKKKIAQYCCAALVAAGIGLNIQNAIENYGIGENSLSLVATGGTGSSGSSSCSSSTPFPAYTSSNLAGQTFTTTSQLCGANAGLWTFIYEVLSDGATLLKSAFQLSHLKWVYSEHLFDDRPLENGHRQLTYQCKNTCTKFPGAGPSDCQVEGDEQILPNKVVII